MVLFLPTSVIVFSDFRAIHKHCRTIPRFYTFVGSNSILRGYKTVLRQLCSKIGTVQLVASASPSCIEAHASLFRLLTKGIFNPNVLWPFDKNVISKLVTRISTRDFMVPIFISFHWLWGGPSLPLWGNIVYGWPLRGCSHMYYIDKILSIIDHLPTSWRKEKSTCRFINFELHNFIFWPKRSDQKLHSAVFFSPWTKVYVYFWPNVYQLYQHNCLLLLAHSMIQKSLAGSCKNALHFKHTSRGSTNLSYVRSHPISFG